MSLHPFHNLIPDTLTIIFQYYIQDVPASHPFVDSYPPADVLFFSQFILAWKFEDNVNVEEFLRKTRGEKLKLFYVSAEWNDSLCNETFKYFRGIHTLSIPNTQRTAYTDLAFENLRGIQRLNMAYCTHLNDEALENVRGVQEIDISACTQLSDKSLENLRGAKVVKMRRCHQFSNDAFSNLRGVQSMNVEFCPQLDDEALVHLRGVRHLKMTKSYSVTNKGLESLIGIESLQLFDCGNFDDTSFLYLRGIKELHIDFRCDNCDVAFKNLIGIQVFESNWCTPNAPRYLRGAHWLKLSMESLQDDDFANFRGVETLILNLEHHSLSDNALRNLIGVKELWINGIKREASIVRSCVRY